MATKKRSKRPRRLLLKKPRKKPRKTNPKKNFTKRWIASIPHPPEGERDIYLDETTPHLRLRVTPTAKTFYWEKTVSKRLAAKLGIEPGTKRVTIGRFPEWNVEQARDRAGEIAGDYSRGIDLQEQVRKQVETAPDDRAFGELWEDYRENHSRRTQQQRENGEYSWTLDQKWKLVFKKKGWDKKKLSDITERTVAELMEEYRHRAPIYANRIHAHGKAMFNFAISDDKWRWKGENPFRYSRLESEDGRERSKKNGTRVHDIPKFIQCLKSAPCSEDMRLLFLCALRTGRRVGEVKAMNWEGLDLDARLWFLKNTKTGPQKTWLPADITDELKDRWKAAGEPEKGWVFPSPSKSGHIEEIKKAWNQVREASGLHKLQARDLRSAFISWQQERGVPIAAVAAQVGHKSIKTTEKHYTAFSDTAQQNWLDESEASTTGDAK